MPTGALLDPSNRLLGGATGDLSLYGALPAVTIGAARPPAADTTLLTVPLGGASAPASGTAQPQPTAFAADFGEAAPLFGSAAPAAPSGAALHIVQAPTAFAVPTLAPQVASPTGAGSTAPIVAGTTLPAIAPQEALSSASPIQSADHSGALTQGIAATSLAAPVVAAEAVGSVTALAPSVVALAAPTLENAAAAAGNVTADLAATVDSAATGASTLLDVAVSDAVPAVEATVSAVAQALPQPAAAVEPVAQAAAVTAAAAVETLAATTAQAADLTAGAIGDDQFAGADPAGGVITLVAMVESAAMFEVGQPSDAPDATPTTGSIVDTLAADEAPGALIGDAAHAVGDAADSVLPDHDHGVPGLI